jgi:hypothetical protein
MYRSALSYRWIYAQLGCESRKCSDQPSSRHGLPHPAGRDPQIARTDSAKIGVSWITSDARRKSDHSLHSCRSSHGLSLQYPMPWCSIDNQYTASSTNLHKHESEGDEHELTHGREAIDSGAPLLLRLLSLCAIGSGSRRSSLSAYILHSSSSSLSRFYSHSRIPTLPCLSIREIILP